MGTRELSAQVTQVLLCSQITHFYLQQIGFPLNFPHNSPWGQVVSRLAEAGMTGGAVRKEWKVNSTPWPSPWLWYSGGRSCESFQREQGGENETSAAAAVPRMTQQLGPGWWAGTPQRVTPDPLLCCPAGWLPELCFRWWCFLSPSREQLSHGEFQATLSWQEKASTWEGYIFLSSLQQEVHISASWLSWVVSVHL